MSLPALPDPPTLRKRHCALMAVEQLFTPAGSHPEYFGFEPPDRYWYDTRSGDEYQLVLVGDDALLTVFDHESPQSPWTRKDQAREWPGMFDGLPEHLRARLPEADPDDPLSVSACFWYSQGAWHMGNPEPIQEDEPDLYTDDPGGANELLHPLTDPEDEVRDLVEYGYEEPDRLPEALALLRERSDVTS